MNEKQAKNDVRQAKIGIGGNNLVRDITEIVGADFSVKEVGKALVQQNKSIVANIASINKSIQEMSEHSKLSDLSLRAMNQQLNNLNREIKISNLEKQKYLKSIANSIKGLVAIEDKRFILEVIKFANKYGWDKSDLIDEINVLLNDQRKSAKKEK